LIQVERVDYIRVPVTDIEEAEHFYGEVLGLPQNPHLDHEDCVPLPPGWDSGVCHGAGSRDPSGNPILLHRPYKRYEQS
jgi:predicted lactoylglutathione lyase